MRELHGVVFPGKSSVELKRRALLFDKFHIWHLTDEEFQKSDEYEAELDFLRLNRVVIDEPPVDLSTFAEKLLADNEDTKRFLDRILSVHRSNRALTMEEQADGTLTILRDDMTRMVSLTTSKTDAFDLVPIYELSMPEAVPNAKAFVGSEIIAANDIASVALGSMPIPDDSASWQDIIDFKAESRDKQWAFRRFLNTLATKHQSEAEIRDEIEWMVNEYRKAMQIHNIKSSQSFVEVFLISPLEILEDLVKFRWSKLAKGMLSVRKRNVELLEAEMRAPGRECAYVFDARKRFGQLRP
jgi:hypothetical protein